MVVELLQQPRGTPEQKLPGGRDRRRARRWHLATLAWLTPVADGLADKRQAFVTNVSLSGIGLRCPQPIPEGEAFYIDVGAGPIKLHARLKVANCRQREDGTYDVGGSFF